MKGNIFRNLMARWGVAPTSQKPNEAVKPAAPLSGEERQLVEANTPEPVAPAKPAERSARPDSVTSAVAAANEPKPASTPAPKRAPLDPEADLFLRTMGQLGVRSKKRAPEDEVPQARPTRPANKPEDEEALFLAAMEGLGPVVVKDEELDPETEQHLHKRRLTRRETHTPGAALDLHGKTTEQALAELGQFVAAEFARSAHSVMVITGKGRNSPGGTSVLKPAVENWIRLRGKRFIESYAEAPQTLGGSGAFVLFLRRQ